MNQPNSRVDRLREEAARLDVARAGSRDGLALGASAVAMVVGLVGIFVAYQSSLGSSDPRDIQSLIILSLFMIGLVVAGAAVFLRYSLARFLRFWLLRQLYEGQAHLDELLAALAPSARVDSAGLDADRVVGERNGGGREDELDAAGHATADLGHGQDADDPGTKD